MSARILWELQFLWRSFLWGLWLMAAYDGLRIFRGLFRHKSFWISSEDVVYWLLCSFVIFSFLYHQDDGVVRWYALFGIGTGMIIWNRTASPYVVRFFTFLLTKIFSVVVGPVRFLTRVIKKGLKKKKK